MVAGAGVGVGVEGLVAGAVDGLNCWGGPAGFTRVQHASMHGMHSMLHVPVYTHAPMDGCSVASWICVSKAWLLGSAVGYVVAILHWVAHAVAV